MPGVSRIWEFTDREDIGGAIACIREIRGSFHELSMFYSSVGVKTISTLWTTDRCIFRDVGRRFVCKGHGEREYLIVDPNMSKLYRRDGRNGRHYC